MYSYVLEQARIGDPASVAAAMENFAKLETWLKLAGGVKAHVLAASLHGGGVRSSVFGGKFLEIGTYCGYSALRLAMTLPKGSQIETLELDPVFAALARCILAFAGVNNVRVWTGHSADTLPMLAQLWYPDGRKFGEHVKSSVPLPFDAVFMDGRGSRFEQDLRLLETLGLVTSGSVIVADNVLKPGAPLYLWHVLVDSRSYVTQIVQLHEFAARADADDWMAVSIVRRPNSRTCSPPLDLQLLDSECDRARLSSMGSAGVTAKAWAAYAHVVRVRLGRVGVEATASASPLYQRKWQATFSGS